MQHFVFTYSKDNKVPSKGEGKFKNSLCYYVGFYGETRWKHPHFFGSLKKRKQEQAFTSVLVVGTVKLQKRLAYIQVLA